MSKDVSLMERKELEDVVIEQSKQLQMLQGLLDSEKKKAQLLEEQYDELSNVVLTARSVLAC